MCLANNIMLVDDDPLSNLLHRIVLRKSNPKFKIKTFSEPGEAFRFLKKQNESRNDELPGIISSILILANPRAGRLSKSCKKCRQLVYRVCVSLFSPLP